MDQAVLEVDDWVGATRWRWRLSTPGGTYLADHQVSIDPPSADWEAFSDLHRYLRWQVDPAKRLSDEAAVVARVGAWAGRELLGPVGKALVEAAPVAVRVRLPEPARALAYLPWELAHVGDRPLALQEVSLVWELGSAPATPKDPVEGALRVLALFSLPVDASALALRRERYEVVRLLDTVATRHDKAIEVRVLQYGVTRERLGDVLEEAPGWDVVHFSGHGRPGEVALERPDGSTDPVAGEDLVKLLGRARRRLKLVVLSTCSSATATASEALRLVGIEPPGPDADGAEEASPAVLPALAQDLVAALGCAVVAMRYPVVDDFAVDLAQGLYDRLVRQGQPLAQALQRALPAAVHDPPTPGTPALSVATPALFGPTAAELSLAPPPGARSRFDPKLASLPPEPERFVGRVGPLARAGAVLVPPAAAPAPPGGWPTAVVFVGMAGAGKTSAATELVYRHHDAFRVVVWNKAPDQGADITGALSSLAVDLEAALAQAGVAGVSLLTALDEPGRLARALHVLSQLMGTTAVLVVVDNVESMLSDQGSWRDPRWGRVVAALVAHQGPGRVVLTSRRTPAGLDPDRVVSETIGALSLAESMLLARQLPHVGPLVRGEAAGVDVAVGRGLVHQVLGLVQGHPKLLELADAQAPDPQALRANLDEAGAAWAPVGDRLGAFLATGRSQVGEDHYVTTLVRWATAAVAALPEPSRLAYGFLCLVEEGDRHHAVLEANWADLWRRLGRQGEPPELAQALAPAGAAALVEADGDPPAYRVHPVLAQAGRAAAAQGFQSAVDAQLAAFWVTVSEQGRDVEGAERGEWVVHAGQAAAPYLIRLGDWEGAGSLLDQVLYRDESPETVAALLPQLRHLAETARGSEGELSASARLARALLFVDPTQAEASLRELVASAEERGQFRVASALAGDLANLLSDRGRLGDALDMIKQKKDYTARAGLGPWTQLAVEGQRLQVLALKGRSQEVLDEVQLLRAHMASLPNRRGPDENVEPWNVREVILSTGHRAALDLGRWQEALDRSAEVAKSKQGRRAPRLEVARTRFNDYFSLLRLARVEEARALLRWCRDVFEAEHDVLMLGMAFGALADVEEQLGRRGEAMGLEERALGYKYAAGDAAAIAVSHFNLAIYLGRAGLPSAALLHRVAAAIIRFQMGSGHAPSTLSALGSELATRAGEAPAPTFEEVCAEVGRVEGVDLARLLGALAGRAPDGEAALAEVLAVANQAASTAGTEHRAQLVEQWRPLVELLAAAAQGDAEAGEALGAQLDELAATPNWGALVAALRRVLAGERDGEALAVDLDEVDGAILAQVLATLEAGP